MLSGCGGKNCSSPFVSKKKRKKGGGCTLSRLRLHSLGRLAGFLQFFEKNKGNEKKESNLWAQSLTQKTYEKSIIPKKSEKKQSQSPKHFNTPTRTWNISVKIPERPGGSPYPRN